MAKLGWYPMSPPPDGFSLTRPIRIATRHSPLALWQAEFVAEQLRHRGCEVSLVPLVSRGDIDMRPMEIARPGQERVVGVFTKRIQEALLDDEADVAVHSLKDLPTQTHPQLTLAAVPRRGPVGDVLVSHRRWSVDQLPTGAIVGTGACRRVSQLFNHRPDVRTLPIRGNVQTRLAKWKNGDYDAIVLAAAGLERLEMGDVPRTSIDLETMLPAPGQGALAIEVRRDDEEVADVVRTIDDPATRLAVTAERSMLARLDGGCLAPIAALATLVPSPSDGEPGSMTLGLRCRVLSTDGRSRIDHDAAIAVVDWRSEGHEAAGASGQAAMPPGRRAEMTDGRRAAEQLGRRAAEELVRRGAGELLRRDA